MAEVAHARAHCSLQARSAVERRGQQVRVKVSAVSKCSAVSIRRQHHAPFSPYPIRVEGKRPCAGASSLTGRSQCPSGRPHPACLPLTAGAPHLTGLRKTSSWTQQGGAAIHTVPPEAAARSATGSRPMRTIRTCVPSNVFTHRVAPGPTSRAIVRASPLHTATRPSHNGDDAASLVGGSRLKCTHKLQARVYSDRAWPGLSAPGQNVVCVWKAISLIKLTPF